MHAKFAMIWQQLEGERTRYGMAALALVVASCFLYLVPLVPQVVLDGVLASDPEAASPFVRSVLERVGGRDLVASNLWSAAVAILVLSAAGGWFTYLRGRWSGLASENVARRLRDRLYDHLQHLPCRYFDTAETGDLVQRCTSDVETFRLFLSSQLVEIVRALVMLMLPLPLMFALDARMTWIAVALVPIIVISATVFFGRIQSRFKDVDEAEGRMTSTIQENLSGIRVVRAFARQEFEEAKFSDRNDKHRLLDLHMYHLMARFWAASDLLCMAQLALVIGAGGYWMSRGELPIGTFYFFLAATNLFLWPVRMMGRILTELGKATVAIGRIYEVLQTPREPDVVARTAMLAQQAGPADPASPHDPFARRFRGAIEFESVRFGHGDRLLFENLSLSVSPGETVALVGPPGAGKSALIHLLLRLYDLSAGTIRLDGEDIASLPRAVVRGAVSIVMQEPFLYSKTVRENIRVGRSDAHNEDVVEAAQAAHVHQAIERFDRGYETVVGERGVTLSGGQRQRVALARALLDRPAVLVLDDAMSAIDTETEALILRALRQRWREQTTIVIAHRISTLMHADRIVVLNDGRIVQSGTHAELANREGLYRQLWRIQSELENTVRAEIQINASDDVLATRES